MARDICVTVGERIRVARGERHWTQQMLADHAELTREHIVRIENGTAEMGLRTFEKIAQALEVNYCFLLQGRPEPKSS